VSGLVALAAGPVHAARFGVPAAPAADPPGWFVLVSPDAVDPARYTALGDWAQRQTLYIEVERRGLRVDLYDPGVFDPARAPGQLDVNLDAVPPLDPADIRYILYGPTGSVLADRTFGADTAGTDRSVVNLFNDNNAVTGLYQLDVRLLDGVPNEQDVTVFGVSVPGHQVFTYNLTAGHVNEGGARIAEPLRAFPWLVRGSAGNDAIGPVCGAAFVSYDLDAGLDLDGDPVAPPSTDVTTRRGYAFPAGEFAPSGDARWTQTEMGGLPFGFLDSNDQGAWEWAFSDLDVPEDVFGAVAPPLDLNAFSIQVLDYGAPPRDGFNWPSVPPFGDSGPRRLYLPQDDDSAPQREWLGHSGQIVAGFPVIALGETSTLDVTIELGNPHAYALTGIVGRSQVTPDVQVSDPVILATGGGLAATLTGRRIDFTGSVAAGGVGTITYRVDVSPTALGRFFLTGDGTSFVPAGAPTVATYQVPYTPSLGLLEEVLGPACEIEYESVIPGCIATAVLTAERTQACPGTPIRLDALASQVINCPGGVPIYQWSVNGALSQPFPAPDTITVTPFLDDTWSVEVACSTDPAACVDSDAVTFALYPSLDVAVSADRTTVCAGDAVLLDAAISNGTPPYVNGRWSTIPTGQPGDGVTTATQTVRPTTTTTYRYTVEDDLACSGTDDLQIVVSIPAPAITPGSLDLCPSESVQVAADAGWSSYSWTTSPLDPAVEGASTPDVMVSRAGTIYTVTVTDATGCTGSASVTPTVAPDLAPTITPPNPALCPGGTVGLSAEPGYATYRWFTIPTDFSVEGSTSPDVVATQIGTSYMVTVTDARGCTGSASVSTVPSPDPLPGPVGPTLRVAKSLPDVLLSWIDIADPVSGYETVFLECPTRDFRTSCAGRLPDLATLAAAPAIGPPAAPGAQADVHAGAGDLGDLIFYRVRALSPCSATPGPIE
jgi:hypothetical protein